MSTILIDLVSEEINCYPCLNHALSADMIDKRKQSNFSYAPLKRQRWRHLNVFAAYELVSNTFLTCSIQLYRMNSSLPNYVLTDTSLIGLHTYRGKLYSTSRAINLYKPSSSKWLYTWVLPPQSDWTVTRRIQTNVIVHDRRTKGFLLAEFVADDIAVLNSLTFISLHPYQRRLLLWLGSSLLLERYVVTAPPIVLEISRLCNEDTQTQLATRQKADAEKFCSCYITTERSLDVSLWLLHPKYFISPSLHLLDCSIDAKVNTLPRRWLLSSSYSNEFMKAFGSS